MSPFFIYLVSKLKSIDTREILTDNQYIKWCQNLVSKYEEEIWGKL